MRDAIDGVRALLPVLERRMPGELGPLRDALSRLQMAYASQAGAAPGRPGRRGARRARAAGEQPSAPDAGEQGGTHGPGPAESSGRLWVPGR